MARLDFNNWIPVEIGDVAIQALVQASVVEALARPESMISDTKRVPRSSGFTISGVAKGGAYSETTSTADYVELIARKAGGVARIAEEDLLDPTVDVLSTKRTDASRNMARFFDNACLATTGAADGTTILYNSVYKQIRTTDSGAGYTADENYMSGSGSYDDLSDCLAKVEGSEWFDEGRVFVTASPAWKNTLRKIKDNYGHPIFVNPDTGGPMTLFGYPFAWSLGCRVSAVNTSSPTGNPLLIFGNRDLLIKGMARLSPEIATPNPGFALQRAATGIGYLTDEALMKAAMRRAFNIGTPLAFSVYEKTS